MLCWAIVYQSKDNFTPKNIIKIKMIIYIIHSTCIVFIASQGNLIATQNPESVFLFHCKEVVF